MLSNMWKKLTCCNYKEDDKVEEKYFDQYNKSEEGCKQPIEEKKVKSAAKNDYRIEFFKPSGKITFYGVKKSAQRHKEDEDPVMKS